MSIRKISIILCIVFPPLLLLGTYLFWSSRLSSGNTGEVERFQKYFATVPTVGYEEIEAELMWQHKQYKPPDAPEESIPLPDSDEQVYVNPAITSMATINDCYSDLSKDLNLYLYQLVQEYAGDMWVGDIQLSPLLILAEANIEGGRVNPSVTFSALASSSVFTFDSVDDLANLSVADCLQSADTWKRMSKEYYTRDRGALQCNPNYAGDDTSYGPSEASKLNDYIQENGIPDYGTQRDSRGNTFTVAEWILSSRKNHGDRFNPESMVRMFANAKRAETTKILQVFPDVINEWQVYCIMAYCHWCGDGYLYFDRDEAYAGFKTVGRSDEYCRDLAQPSVIEALYSICLQDIQDARSAGRNPVSHLDKNTGRAVFNKLVNQGLLKEWDYYFRHLVSSNGWDQGATACSYPIALIYGVIQMSLLYSGC